MERGKMELKRKTKAGGGEWIEIKEENNR